MTDSELENMEGDFDLLRIPPFSLARIRAVVAEARRARASEAALKADISVMEKVFADYTACELPDLGIDALDLSRRQGHAGGLLHAAVIANAVKLEAAARIGKLKHERDACEDAAYHGAREACADEIARRIEAETPPPSSPPSSTLSAISAHVDAITA
jgi:hypothetical protein